jgi:hypothetical protein
MVKKTVTHYRPSVKAVVPRVGTLHGIPVVGNKPIEETTEAEALNLVDQIQQGIAGGHMTFLRVIELDPTTFAKTGASFVLTKQHLNEGVLVLSVQEIK